MSGSKNLVRNKQMLEKKFWERYFKVMIYWILKKIFGPFVKLIWIKKAEGLENVPKKGAFIIASNHSSYFDFISLIAVCPRRIYFLAGEVFFKK